jgi:uncharacterized protein YutE (UPF0331/DUF86 family)
MIDKSLVDKKIREIKNYIQELEEIIKFNERKILRDYIKMRALERIFQLIVDEMIHLNLHFISRLELKTPDSFQSSFEIIAQKEILPYDFAIKIALAVGLRNRLVHRYEKVDPKFFLEQVKKEYKDFVKYVKYINEYLRKN